MIFHERLHVFRSRYANLVRLELHAASETTHTDTDAHSMSISHPLVTITMLIADLAGGTGCENTHEEM